MEKSVDPAGSPLDRGHPGTKRLKEIEQFKNNLLRKRRTYQGYFERGLRAINMALRRVALNREVRSGLVTKEILDDDDPREPKKLPKPVLSASAAAKVAAFAKESVGKEKKKLKKYAGRVASKACAASNKRARSLISWERRRQKREKEESASRWRAQLEDRAKLFRELGPTKFDELLRKEERERKKRKPILPWYVDGFGRAVRSPHLGPVSSFTLPTTRLDEVGAGMRERLDHFHRTQQQKDKTIKKV
jgi:hypothetical protein